MSLNCFTICFQQTPGGEGQIQRLVRVMDDYGLSVASKIYESTAMKSVSAKNIMMKINVVGRNSQVRKFKVLRFSFIARSHSA